MKKQIWEKFRYEFMRRDPEYLKAWHEVVELRSKAEYPPEYKEEEITHNGVRTVVWPYWETPEGQKEREYACKFRLLAFIDPALSFDELSEAKTKNLIYKPRFILGDNAVKCILSPTKVKKLRDGYLTIEIDFNKVNSKDALKKQVNKIIDSLYHNNNSIKKLNESRLKDIVKVGDLKQNNPEMSFVDIGKIVYGVEDDSKRVDASTAYKAYQHYINGGWRELIFP